MGSRDSLVRRPGVPEPVLRVPPERVLHLVGIGADRGAAAGRVHARQDAAKGGARAGKGFLCSTIA